VSAQPTEDYELILRASGRAATVSPELTAANDIPRLTPAREYKLRNERAHHELQLMRDSGIYNIPRILALLEGRA
jgi:hypothetical protein